MKVLSLFSGVGGFDMGLENAGMETVFQCEWDKHANSILHRHWPDVPKWDDVSTLTGKHILANATVVDVVAWGSPCQDLSVAGKRAGLEGGRSGLFHEGIRIIKELQEETNGQYPRISIWENVVGALNSNGGADFGVILNEMAQAGALVIEWAVLDAQYFGIPQRRRRVFVIAIFDPFLAERSPSPLLPVAESLPGHLAKGKQKRESAATTLTESIGTDGRIVNAIGASIYHKQTVVNQDVNSGHLVVGALAARDYKGVGNQYVAENKCVVEPFVKSSRVQTSEDSDHVNAVAQGQEPTVFQPGTMVRLGGGVWDGTVPTLRAEAKRGDNEPHIAIHNGEPTMAVRRLTPLECERLMGWPDNHTLTKADGTTQADTHRYKQCGNGVASPVAQWIAKHLLNI